MESKYFKPRLTKETQNGVLQRYLIEGHKIADDLKTRHISNRLMYKGDQYLRVTSRDVRALAPSDRLPNGIRRVTINRMRIFVDARVSMMTHAEPGYVVESTEKDENALRGARMATKFVRAHWGPHAWSVNDYGRTALLYAEQDGIAFGYVGYNKNKGDFFNIMFDNETGQPVTDINRIAALRELDVQGATHWHSEKVGRGEIEFRVQRSQFLSIDPLAKKHLEDANWIIETRVMSVHDVEAEAEMRIKDLLKKARQARGIEEGTGSSGSGTSNAFNAMTEDEDGQSSQTSQQDSIVVRECWIKPQGEFGYFPRGLHAKWIDQAPDYPYVEEEWMHFQLPWFELCPRPDGTHFLKSRGICDDLSPVQVAFNKCVSMLHEWIELVGRPTLIIHNGTLRSKTVFNESRITYVNGGSTPPQFMRVPNDPSIGITNHLYFLLDQMKEISAQHDASRGQAPGKGIESGVSLDTLIEQNEMTLSAVANSYKNFLERSMKWALQEVIANYDLPRTVAGPGIDDPSEFKDFVGLMIRGADHFRINTPILPRSRDQQVRLLMELTSLLGPDRVSIDRWIPQLLEGEIDDIIRQESSEPDDERREIDEMVALASHENANQWMKDFESARLVYVEALNNASASGLSDVKSLYQSQGAPPPTLETIGVPVPVVEEGENHALRLTILTDFMSSVQFNGQPPIVKQAVREHKMKHIEKQAQEIQQRMLQMRPMVAQAGGSPNGGG